MLTKLAIIAAAYLAGSLPLAPWIGRLAGVDIRQAGDGNPGATNVLRAAGWGWGLLALCADFSKAAVPVGLAYHVFGWRDWLVVPLALAPSFGHAYPPWPGARGGKALATVLGAWIGLTLHEMPLVLLPVLTLAFVFLSVDGWSVLLAGAAGLIYLLLFRPEPLLLAVILGQIALVMWTHRADLRRRPALRARWRRSPPGQGRRPS